MSSEFEVPGTKLPDVVKPDTKDASLQSPQCSARDPVAAAAPVLGHGHFRQAGTRGTRAV